MYRTKTYIAGDWTGDNTVIEQLYKWNESNYWGLSFNNAHELTQARDESLNCSIKASLKSRLAASKTFILIVGENTKNLRAGSCQYCSSYNSWTNSCSRHGNTDFRSYIEYECEQAIKANMKIIILYNSVNINKSKCPDILKICKAQHLTAYKYNLYGSKEWNYEEIKNAIMNS